MAVSAAEPAAHQMRGEAGDVRNNATTSTIPVQTVMEAMVQIALVAKDITVHAMGIAWTYTYTHKSSDSANT